METRHLLPLPFLLALALPLEAQAPLQRKQVAAPAADIQSALVRLPDRWAHPETIRGNLLEFGGQGQAGQVSFWAPAGNVRVIPIWEDRAVETWDFRFGSGEWLPWHRLDSLGLGLTEEVAPTDTWTSMSPQRLTIALPSATLVSIRAAHGQHVLIGDSSAATLEHGLDTYRLQQGQTVSSLARLTGTDDRTAILKAELQWATSQASGTLAMHDDGRHGDRAAHDGIWGARLPLDTIGDVTATTRIVARGSKGQRFSRTGVHRFRMEARSVAFTGEVRVGNIGSDAWSLQMPAAISTPLPFVHLAAEVWGTNADGAAQPICWMARQCEVDPAQTISDLTLELDRGWIEGSALAAPFELRHVRVQDPNTWTVLTDLDHLALDLPRESGMAPAGPNTGTRLTFRASAPPPSGVQQAGHATAQTAGPAFGLMLVHGWCSGGGVWPPSQFNHPLLVHHDPDANRSHDEFAQMLAALGSGRRSFGVIGHSQGGPAAMQLRTYYVSGLDRAQGGRPIQSLASPYQGTPLAGLGFFLCGSSTDLGTSGSAAWLANIPSSVRDEVYYYTTSNSGWACNFATNIFLSNPEDGTVEQFRGQLPGAHNMGHVTGWCHTTGMSDPAGYQDSARNAIMNQEAAN